jgi:FKBP12-rapamycin complex-associated protein
LIQPYLEPILKVLLPKARDQSAVVSSQIVTAIGQLAIVGATEIKPHLTELLEVIIETLQDQSSPMKREASLKTLAQISSNTGWVIEPYIKYPNLLNLLIKILKSEQSSAIRCETVKLLGVLGALDPYKHQVFIAYSSF